MQNFGRGLKTQSGYSRRTLIRWYLIDSTSHKEHDRHEARQVSGHLPRSNGDTSKPDEHRMRPFTMLDPMDLYFWICILSHHLAEKICITITATDTRHTIYSFTSYRQCLFATRNDTFDLRTIYPCSIVVAGLTSEHVTPDSRYMHFLTRPVPTESVSGSDSLPPTLLPHCPRSPWPCLQDANVAIEFNNTNRRGHAWYIFFARRVGPAKVWNTM